MLSVSSARENPGRSKSIYESVDLMYFGVSFLAYLARSLCYTKNFILETTQGVVPAVKFFVCLDFERKSY